MKTKEVMLDMFGGDPNANIDLEDVKAFIENGKVYLKLVYRVENAKEIIAVTVPKAELPLPTHTVVITDGYEEGCTFDELRLRKTWVSMRDAKLTIEPDKNGHKFIQQLVKKKTRKMTVSEIEKALGYSVEIVSE